ncbi:MAG: DNA methyltransferase [Pseudomonadota bacterium]|nr:DNA methyltransferase [Pseudomonadota bacterium]
MLIENQIIQGDCTKVLPQLPRESIDLVVTDPPYGVRYTDRYGRTVANDDDLTPVLDAFGQVYRVLKQNSFCISFYGWNRVDEFFRAWRAAGFCPVGHLVWRKSYGSSRSFLEARHEQAYLLAKGRPAKPAKPISDVRDWEYSGNKAHPTQKSPSILRPLIEAFSWPNDLVLDPFSGSGSTSVAAKQAGRRFLGIELEPHYCEFARMSLGLQPAGEGGQVERFTGALADFTAWMKEQGIALPADFEARAQREWSLPSQ